MKISRIDLIGLNGATAEHYEVVDKQKETCILTENQKEEAQMNLLQKALLKIAKFCVNRLDNYEVSYITDEAMGELEDRAEDIIRSYNYGPKYVNVIYEQLGITSYQIKDTDRLVEDLGADSLDLIEVIMALEEEYGIEIPHGFEENMMGATVADVARIVEGLGGEE
jgi:acyl carrier protein